MSDTPRTESLDELAGMTARERGWMLRAKAAERALWRIEKACVEGSPDERIPVRGYVLTVAREALWNVEPWDESQEGQEADRPEDLPVPANADKRYCEQDGG